jgi:hypothetical protein
MPRKPPLFSRTRRSRLLVWLAVWLSLVQVLGASEHLSAMAATAAGASGDGPLGFLNICTAQGLATIPAGETGNTPDGTVSHACALCSMDCAAGSAIVPANTPLLAGAPTGIVARPEWKRASFITVFWRHNGVRGPPSWR